MDYELVSIVSLMLAMASVWLRPVHLWTVPFSLFVITGLVSGWITPPALVSGLLFAAIVRFHMKAQARHYRIAAALLLVIGALVLGVHLAPGFETTTRLAETLMPAQAEWGGVRFTADKPLVGLFLLLAYRDRLCQVTHDWKRAFAVTVIPMLFGIMGVYAVGLALGYVVFDPSAAGLSALPVMGALFARNLFFTVMAEEMLFRQVIQSGLDALYRGPYAKPLALLTASVLFGLVHLPGGWQFGLLAALAGAVYGYAFMRSGRVEMAMVAHIALNTGNVLLLSIPTTMIPATP